MIPFIPDLRRRQSCCLVLRVACASILLYAAAASCQQTAPGTATQQPTAADAHSTAAPASSPAQNPTSDQSAAPQNTAAQPASSASAPAINNQPSDKSEAAGGITEEQLKQMIVGKPLFLRGGYMDNNLTYNEHGALISGSPHGSFTLCAVQIDKVHLTRHKIELVGARYGLHFLGALAYEDPTKAADRVRITPKKKVVRITIDRELVVKPKKEKAAKNGNEKGGATKAPAQPSAEPAPETASSARPAGAQTANTTTAPNETSDADEAKAEIAGAPPAEQPADPKSVTTTSPAHATMVLKQALDSVFAQSLDDRMIAAMPDFWKFYYQAVAAKTDYRPADPAVLRQNTVDQKAKLLTNFEPESNEFAQANGVAGVSLYHVVIGTDGKPSEIAVARPIGFGLDENAVEAIRHAKFEPAIKDGKTVPVLLDLVVQFRIYSKRTAVSSSTETADKAAEPPTPGPYSVQH